MENATVRYSVETSGFWVVIPRRTKKNFRRFGGDVLFIS